MTNTTTQLDLNTLVSLCKRRGFIFQSSEIYGGLASTWDYGPLGVELKRNVKDAWWRRMVWERDDMVGLDSAVLMHADVWRASGHIENFTDPLAECTECHQRWRIDQIDAQECPSCSGALTEPRMFNLMLKTYLGPVENNASVAYLRPETAQGIFVNFENVLTSTRRKLPFGIAQSGKAFRNEITTRNFIFRTREFEIMELEFFVKPGEDEKWHQRWVEESRCWYGDLGLPENRLRLRNHETNELAHYSKATTDIEYQFPWGWGEISGIANRTDYDLKAHSEASGKQLTYFDQETNKHITPYVVEPTFGVDRSVFAFLSNAYVEENAPTASSTNVDRRVVLKLHPILAPIKVAVLPLSRNETLAPLAKRVFDTVRNSQVSNGMVQYDDTQSIGRRYRRQDEVGTPLCITVDFESLDDGKVTIRDRDTMAQDRVSIERIVNEIGKRLKHSPTI